MESSKIIYVHLRKKPAHGTRDFFFGSIAAAYDALDENTLGVKQSYLRNYLRDHRGRYKNDNCIITVGAIVRKASSRRKPPKL